MRTIRKRYYFFAVFTGFSLIISFLIYICGIFMPRIHTHLLFAVTLSGSVCMACLWLREYRKLEMVQLIVGNQILHITSAAISDRTKDAANIEVFISYFGVLIDTKIIKFNQDGIRLKAVKIGSDFVLLTYGTDKRTQNAWFLRSPIDDKELDRIVEQFRYETGVMPVIIN